MALADPVGAGAPKPDKLRALGIVALNGMFDEMDAEGVLRQAVDLLPDDLAIVSSFGTDSAVILHMIAGIDPNLPVLFLETGKHFPETLAYVESLSRELGLTNVRGPDAGCRRSGTLRFRRRFVGNRPGFVLPYPQDRAARHGSRRFRRAG